jgi:hypothetical protein
MILYPAICMHACRRLLIILPTWLLSDAAALSLQVMHALHYTSKSLCERSFLQWKALTACLASLLLVVPSRGMGARPVCVGACVRRKKAAKVYTTVLATIPSICSSLSLFSFVILLVLGRIHNASELTWSSRLINFSGEMQRVMCPLLISCFIGLLHKMFAM